MGEFANQRFFDQPFSRLLAMGCNPGQPILDPYGGSLGWLSNGGIADPARDELAVGTRMVRFAGSGQVVLARQGNWWLQFDEYTRLVRIASSRGMTVGAVIRHLCLIPPEWSNMDVIVQVRLTAPLLAWAGVGGPVQMGRPGDPSAYRLTGLELGEAPARQLYIPGLASGDLVRDALATEGSGFLPESHNAGYFIRCV